MPFLASCIRINIVWSLIFQNLSDNCKGPLLRAMQHFFIFYICFIISINIFLIYFVSKIEKWKIHLLTLRLCLAREPMTAVTKPSQSPLLFSPFFPQTIQLQLTSSSYLCFGLLNCIAPLCLFDYSKSCTILHILVTWPSDLNQCDWKVLIC